MSHNFLMLETLPSKELAVAEEVDRLVGMDSSYCPLWYDLKKISRNEKFRGRTTKTTPVIPRLIFVTSSFPDLAALASVRGVEGVVRNPWGAPEVVPGWEMLLFKDAVEALRQRVLRASEPTRRVKSKWVPLSGTNVFEALKKAVETGELIDLETGEILDKAAA